MNAIKDSQPLIYIHKRYFSYNFIPIHLLLLSVTVFALKTNEAINSLLQPCFRESITEGLDNSCLEKEVLYFILPLNSTAPKTPPHL